MANKFLNKFVFAIGIIFFLQENVSTAYKKQIDNQYFNGTFTTKQIKHDRGRGGRYLFPFAVVNFPPEPCSPVNTPQLMDGVCLSKKRCTVSSGEAVGNCQQGLGTCCKFVKQCHNNRRSVTVLETVENLINPSIAGACEFAFPRQQGICQIKLDFINVVLQEPQNTGPNAGNCQSESLTVVGAANLNGPLRVCGRLTGQHMILSYGATSDLINVVVQSEMLSAVYNIRATQIPCNSILKAPDDCLQYYTSTSAAVKSFGYPRQLNNQKYTICVKPNSGGSSVSWDRCLDNDAEGVLQANRFRVSHQTSPCLMDWIAIDAEKRCGHTFSPIMTSMSSHARIRVNFDENEVGNDVFSPIVPEDTGVTPMDICRTIQIKGQNPFPQLPQPAQLCTYTTTLGCQCKFSNMPDQLAQILIINIPNAQANYICPKIRGYTASPERLPQNGADCNYYANIRVTDRNDTGFCLRYQAL